MSAHGDNEDHVDQDLADDFVYAGTPAPAEPEAGEQDPADQEPAAEDAGEAADTAPGDQDPEDEEPAAEDAPSQPTKTAAATAGTRGVLPNKAAEDDPRRWGDQPGSYDHDAWLREQRPPHWG